MSHRISATSIVIVPCQQYPSESSYMPTLQIIISPAKTMRRAGAQTPADDVLPLHVPPFPEASAYLVSYLQSCSRDKLQTLWHTSDKLTDACYEITRELEVPQTYNQARSSHFSTRVTPALFTYDGLQFRSMAPEVLDQDSLTWLDEHLWILSGLYGCVRPYDAVMPYRLEMAAHINLDAPAGHLKSLYDFWGDRIAHTISDTHCIVNLASVEYARAVLPHVSCKTITCLFAESIKNDKPLQRATASKTARGSFVRWMAEHEIDNPEQLGNFDLGYRFDERYSTPSTLVFVRE